MKKGCMLTISTAGRSWKIDDISRRREIIDGFEKAVPMVAGRACGTQDGDIVK
jgi:hypothetical protein